MGTKLVRIGAPTELSQNCRRREPRLGNQCVVPPVPELYGATVSTLDNRFCYILAQGAPLGPSSLRAYPRSAHASFYIGQQCSTRVRNRDLFPIFALDVPVHTLQSLRELGTPPPRRPALARGVIYDCLLDLSVISTLQGWTTKSSLRHTII